MMIDVETPAGTLRGERLGTAEGLVFRGVPYAQPPTGALRFAAARPVAPWPGVREARRFGPAVPQSRSARRASAVPADVTTSDDYLTLNAWTPDRRGARPVMVWIHGGAYMGGATTNPVFDGTRLALEGDVVVVTVNHRVGVEGYAAIAGAPANRGLLDVVAALEWVRDSIAAFGGDPGNVTVFGQSAGAGAVASLLVMPSARGLFHRAIAQSVPGTFLSPALAAEVATGIAEEVGRAATVAELAQVDPQVLAEAADRLRDRMAEYTSRWGTLAATNTPFSPVVDGDVLPTDPWTAATSGVPLLVGHTRHEFRAFPHGEITAADAARAVELFGPVNERDLPPGDPETVFETVNGDWLFRMPSARLATVHAAQGSPTYLFELAYTVPRMDGAPHGADNPLIFGNFAGGTADRFYVQPVAAETERLGARMRRAWARFAHTGDPGWDRFTGDGQQTMLFDVEPAQQRYPHARTLAAYSRSPIEVLDLAPVGTAHV
jgi:para-nitrobenzyl esterase